MLEILKSDGFGPLHYSAYWLLGQYVKLDPFWMRVIPAGAGTLMVPAMYWLARQMTNRKASLLAAAIACFSAYLMAYSHDAKMYMHFWLMCALHVAALLHWVRSGSRLVWWVWVATGIAAIGLHTWAAVVVAVEGLIFVTALGESWRLAIGDWRSKARTGVPIANDAAIGLTVGAIADSKLNIGDSTHVSQNANRKWQIANLMLAPLVRCAGFAIGLALIAVGPYLYYTRFNEFMARTDVVAPGAIDLNAKVDGNSGSTGTEWVESINRGRTGWGYVLDSSTSYLFGYEWPNPQVFHWYHTADPSLRATTAQIPDWIRSSVVAALVMLLIFCAVGAMPWPARLRTDASLDPPPASRWLTMFWLAVWIVLPVYAVFYCRSVDGFTGPADWIDLLGSLFDHQWLWIASAWIALGVAMTLIAGLRNAIAAACGFAICFGLILALAGGGDDWLDRWLALLTHPMFLLGVMVIVPPTIFAFAGDSIGQRLGRLAMFTLVAGAIVGLCWLAHLGWTHTWQRAVAKNPQINWLSIWHPRYLGFIWPAVAIAVAVLLMRLPTRTLRYAAIVFFLGLNATNSIARLVAGSEPPYDKIAADVVATRPKESTLRVFTNFYGGEPLTTGPAPSQGGLMDHPLSYYFVTLSDLKFTPIEFRSHRPREEHYADIFLRSPRGAAQRASFVPHVTRLVVWWRHVNDTPQWTSDPFLDDLQKNNPNWKLAGTETHAIRVYWNWRSSGCVERREYVREKLNFS